jgi:chromosome segregation ATPase
MSTAAIEQPAKPKMTLQEHRKQSAEERKGQLSAEIRELVKERTKTREEVDSLIAERVRLTVDVAHIKGLEASNADLLDRLSALENECRRLKASETARKQEQQAAMDQFIAKCEAVSKVQPGFDECLRRIADISESWLQEIAAHPNGPGLVLFLGTEPCAFLQYLLEVKPEVAIKRLRQAGYDMHHKLPKLQGGN